MPPADSLCAVSTRNNSTSCLKSAQCQNQNFLTSREERSGVRSFVTSSFAKSDHQTFNDKCRVNMLLFQFQIQDNFIAIVDNVLNIKDDVIESKPATRLDILFSRLQALIQ